jgi:hypothetical protein
MRLKFTLIVLLTLPAHYYLSAQNSALSFTGTNTVTTTAMIVPTSGDFTVEFWYDVTTDPTGKLMEFVSQGVGTTNGFYIGIDGIHGDYRAGDKFITTGVAPIVNQWAHIALTNAAGTATLYVNGVPMATSPGYSISTTGDNFKLGDQFTGFSEPYTGSLDQLRIWSVALTQAQIKQTMYGTVLPSATGLIADYEMNEGAGTTMGNSTATTGLDGTLAGSPLPSWINSPVQFGNNSLNFDGVDDRVVAPANTAFDISTGTVEADINPSVLNATNMEIAGNRSGGNTRYSFHVSSTQILLWNGTAPIVWDFAGTMAGVPFTIPMNAWTHLSWTADGTNITLYVNGSSVGALPGTLGTLTNMTFDIGFSNNGGPGVDNEFFQGSIDEVRVWNAVLTPTQILQYMGQTLTGTEPGLVALYSFDQGIAGGTNTDLVDAVDKTINSNNATLFNFALTGTTSNFNTSPLVSLPVTISSFTATRSGSQALLRWQTAQEENSHDFSIEHSTDGTIYTSIGDVPAAGNSNKPTSYSFIDEHPATGLNYYRLKESDIDGHSMYSQIRTVAFPTSSAQRLIWAPINGSNVQVSLLNGSNEFYTLSAIDGRTIRKGQFAAGKLYLSGLESGIYIVNATTFTGQQLTAKVLVP